MNFLIQHGAGASHVISSVGCDIITMRIRCAIPIGCASGLPIKPAKMISGVKNESRSTWHQIRVSLLVAQEIGGTIIGIGKDRARA